MRSVAVIRKEGMEYLTEKLGILETEVFISSLLRDRFDYTEWQRDYFDNKFSAEEFLQNAADFDKRFPFKPVKDSKNT
ncbi:MAG: hypothetical protein LBT05_07450 [Planctomycetaceae bacterium]|nr:hypothetical protein [Planctomycetaceae bacterium]